MVRSETKVPQVVSKKVPYQVRTPFQILMRYFNEFRSML